MLLYRNKLQPEEIRDELQALQNGERNDFTGKREWIHNNFIGSYLQLFAPQSRPCHFYAGFIAFCQLSHGNVRHFLELCHQSVNGSEEWEAGTPVTIESQAEAARLASASFLREVQASGPQGLQLYNFVMRLGSLFALAHQRPSQSEAEQTHFTITEGKSNLSAQDHTFLAEAVKWSVLYEEPETKAKRSAAFEDSDYVLNPIYAPYFHISYRKKRSIKLKTNELIVLVRGSYEDLAALLSSYSQAWSVNPAEVNPSLFSHIGDF